MLKVVLICDNLSQKVTKKLVAPVGGATIMHIVFLIKTI